MIHYYEILFLSFPINFSWKKKFKKTCILVTEKECNGVQLVSVPSLPGTASTRARTGAGVRVGATAKQPADQPAQQSEQWVLHGQSLRAVVCGIPRKGGEPLP